MPNVTLLYYTGMESPDPYYAARLLAFTKNTRLNMSPEGMKSFMEKPESEIDEELKYMASTIRSALEFAHVEFLVQDISRGTAQQVTRTRTAAFQMQSQRVSDMRSAKWEYVSDEHDSMMKAAIDNYGKLVDGGMSLEDARDTLPIGLYCNTAAVYSLRHAIDVIRARKSPRVQGPYREVALQMEAELLRVWPWVHYFLAEPDQLAYDMLLEVVDELKEQGAVYKGAAGKIAKAIDLLKTRS